MQINHLILMTFYFLSAGASAGGFFPSAEQWKASALYAAKDPATWAPLSGALLVKATNSDQHISDWASDRQPVFGDEDVADGLRDSLALLAFGTLLFSPRQHIDDEGWAEEKGARAAEMMVATGLADGTTGMLKNIVRRKRPYDPHSNASYGFPSGHATESFAWAATTRRNLEDYDLSDNSMLAWNIGIYSLAGGCAWARVETQEHYPTDVLAGAAIGNFVATTIYRAFAGDGANSKASVAVNPAHRGLVLDMAWYF